MAVFTPDGEAVYDQVKNNIHHYEDASGDEVQRNGRPDVATVGDFLDGGVSAGVPYEDTYVTTPTYSFVDDASYSYYNDYGGYGDYGGWYDDWDLEFPVILDLDGDGVEINSRLTSSVYFDYGDVNNVPDGYAERTSWAGRDDGFLIIDLAAKRRVGGVINQTIGLHLLVKAA